MVSEYTIGTPETSFVRVPGSGAGTKGAPMVCCDLGRVSNLARTVPPSSALARAVKGTAAADPTAPGKDSLKPLKSTNLKLTARSSPPATTTTTKPLSQAVAPPAAAPPRSLPRTVGGVNAAATQGIQRILQEPITFNTADIKGLKPPLQQPITFNTADIKGIKPPLQQPITSNTADIKGLKPPLQQPITFNTADIKGLKPPLQQPITSNTADIKGIKGPLQQPITSNTADIKGLKRPLQEPAVGAPSKLPRLVAVSFSSQQEGPTSVLGPVNPEGLVSRLQLEVDQLKQQNQELQMKVSLFQQLFQDKDRLAFLVNRLATAH